MEHKGGNLEVLPSAPEISGERAVFGTPEAVANENEQLRTEALPEAVPMAMPPELTALGGAEENGVDEEIDLMDVSRDAEKISKKATTQVFRVLRKYRDDPRELQKKVTSLKWDYMRKAFDRDLGDGLDGSGKKDKQANVVGKVA